MVKRIIRGILPENHEQNCPDYEAIEKALADANENAAQVLCDSFINFPDSAHDQIKKDRLIGIAARLSRVSKAALKKQIKSQEPRFTTSALIMSSSGPASCVTNCTFWLEPFATRLEFNRMAMRHELDRVPLQDADILAFLAEIERISRVVIKKTHVIDAVEHLGHKNAYHPVIEYLEGLAWDGIPRVDSLLSDHFGIEDSPYARAIGRVMLIGAVKRILNPGNNFRYVPILIGDQQIGKSTALSILFGQWHYSTNTNLGSSQMSFEIQGKWCLELGDLHAFQKSDIDGLKNFISARVDHFRAPYGHYYLDVPRSLIIIGTANRHHFLRDETGETRFLPIKCGPVIDTDAIERNRDQLFAEAYSRRNEEVWLSDAEIEEAEEAREDASDIDAWEGPILRYVFHQDRCKVAGDWPMGWTGLPAGNPFVSVTTMEIWENCNLGGEKKSNIQRGDQMRIGAILRRAGLKRERITIDGYREYKFWKEWAPTPPKESEARLL
jgi:hypothetical protein